MNVLIIEDEKPAARRLHRMLAKLNIDVQQMLHSVEESLNWLQNNKHPDLIFLDIQLSDGLSFEIFEEICKFSDAIMIDRGDLSAEIGDNNLYDAILKISNLTS